MSIQGLVRSRVVGKFWRINCESVFGGKKAVISMHLAIALLINGRLAQVSDSPF